MTKEYIKIASVPKDERIVSTTMYGGYSYWDFRFPFKHYKTPRFLVATEKAIYEVISGEDVNK